MLLQIARELPQGKKRYFGLFTLSNLIFLAILLGGAESSRRLRRYIAGMKLTACPPPGAIATSSVSADETSRSEIV